MEDKIGIGSRISKAIHGARREAVPDASSEIEFAARLRETETLDSLRGIYDRYAHGHSQHDYMMRRIIWRAMAKSVGHGLKVEPGVGFKHIETFEIGDEVFIGSQSFVQGRFDGVCKIGDFTWIGPQSYFDARHLVIGEKVGWGPGAKVLGSAHTAEPTYIPIIETDLEIKPVNIGPWADIGVNATILPGVTIGQGGIVGAGAVVTKDVLPFTTVAGVPATVLNSRSGK